MTLSVNDTLEILYTKSPAELLNPNEANNLYGVVPTSANQFLGLKEIMGKKTSHTPYIKYTAREPIKGLMLSTEMGAKSPVSAKLESQTEKHIIVKFKDSLLFTEQELFVIEQAKRSDPRDAETREAAEAIIHNVEGLKSKNLATMEKLFWEGLRGQMNVTQINSGVESDIQIATQTRSVSNLTSTDKWDYHLTNPSASTADPVITLQKLKQSFTGKGGKLKTVYMNRVTFDNMTSIPSLRQTVGYTSSKLELSGFESINIAGVTCTVYDEGYLNAQGNFVNFIPNGYIIGLGQGFSGIHSIADLVECLNLDATSNNGTAIKSVYGTHFRIKTIDDPVSLQFLISNFALPVIKNPQLVVSQKVF